MVPKARAVGAAHRGVVICMELNIYKKNTHRYKGNCLNNSQLKRQNLHFVKTNINYHRKNISFSEKSKLGFLYGEIMQILYSCIVYIFLINNQIMGGLTH